MKRIWAFGIVSFVASLFTVISAFQERKQFYLVCQHLSTSTASLVVVGSFALYCIFLLSLGSQKLLFGELRLIEREVFYFFNF